jgi:hypothetical protein
MSSTERLCVFGGCERQLHARELCAAHYKQWSFRGRDMAVLTPVRHVCTHVEDMELDVDEFEHLLAAGESVERAVDRMGICARSVVRRYQRVGKPVPAGLWSLA